LGEFGATVIVAGNIPGKTQTLALAIFNDIQVGRDDEARLLVGITAALAFGAVWISEVLLRRREARI
jgi:molybdate transport system permease protein